MRDGRKEGQTFEQYQEEKLNKKIANLKAKKEKIKNRELEREVALKEERRKLAVEKKDVDIMKTILDINIDVETAKLILKKEKDASLTKNKKFNEYHKAWREKNRQYFRKYHRDRYRRLKNENKDSK